MIAYRISSCKYIKKLDGEGARLHGARWNSMGNAMVYLASSRALAVLEVLVHLQPLYLPFDFCIAEIEIPGQSILTLAADSLPRNWKDISPPAALKQIGNQFLKDSDYLVMKVPSSVVEQEHNYLLNPLHPLMQQVRVIKSQPFTFDERLMK